VPLEQNTPESSEESNAPLLDLNNAMATTSSDDEPNEYSMASASNAPVDYVNVDPGEGQFETATPSEAQPILNLEVPSFTEDNSSGPRVNIVQAPLNQPLEIDPTLQRAPAIGPVPKKPIEVPFGPVKAMTTGFENQIVERQNVKSTVGNLAAKEELNKAGYTGANPIPNRGTTTVPDPMLNENVQAAARDAELRRNGPGRLNSPFFNKGGKQKTIRKKKKNKNNKTVKKRRGMKRKLKKSKRSYL
jgi:hypothetical protein